jgi:hypothetical protein
MEWDGMVWSCEEAEANVCFLLSWRIEQLCATGELVEGKDHATRELGRRLKSERRDQIVSCMYAW